MKIEIYEHHHFSTCPVHRLSRVSVQYTEIYERQPEMKPRTKIRFFFLSCAMFNNSGIRFIDTGNLRLASNMTQEMSAARGSPTAYRIRSTESSPVGQFHTYVGIQVYHTLYFGRDFQCAGGTIAESVLVIEKYKWL